MCGICGIVGFGNQKTIEWMTPALAHRGPDDVGFCFFPQEEVGLGHRRFSIIDLSPAGRQPMSNEDESLWIVVNGETITFSICARRWRLH